MRAGLDTDYWSDLSANWLRPSDFIRPRVSFHAAASQVSE